MRSRDGSVKRVLMLAYFFPPLGGGGCQRTLKLVRYLEPQGWQATVVTTRDQDYWILDPSLEQEIPASTEVRRAGGLTGGRVVQALSRAGLPVQEGQGSRRGGSMRALRSVQSWVVLPDSYRSWGHSAVRSADHAVRDGGAEPHSRTPR